jgi:hypothetical protein
MFDARMASILTGMAEERAICGLMPLLSLDLLLICVFVERENSLSLYYIMLNYEYFIFCIGK